MTNNINIIFLEILFDSYSGLLLYQSDISKVISIRAVRHYGKNLQYFFGSRECDASFSAVHSTTHSSGHKIGNKLLCVYWPTSVLEL